MNWSGFLEGKGLIQVGVDNRARRRSRIKGAETETRGEYSVKYYAGGGYVMEHKGVLILA